MPPTRAGRLITMFMLYALLVGLLVGLAAGGRPGRLADLRLVWVPLAMAALLVQVVIFSEPMSTALGGLGSPIYVASTALVLLVVVRNVPRAPGLALVVLGTSCNLAAILANGGHMPVTPEALGMTREEVAWPEVALTFGNSVLTPHPALEPLVDRFSLPGWLPFTNVFSVGDVLIGAGIVTVMAVGMRGHAAPGHPDPARSGEPAVRSGPSLGGLPEP